MELKYNNMGNDEDSKQKQHSDTMFSDGNIPESNGIRHTSGQGNTLNWGLLDYNVYLLCVGGPIILTILWIIH